MFAYVKMSRISDPGGSKAVPERLVEGVPGKNLRRLRLAIDVAIAQDFDL